MTENCVLYSNNRLFYYKQGEGKKFILLFHGFGQNHQSFQSWSDKLSEEYTVFSFDLFFHRASEWTSRNALEKGDWKEIIRLILEKEKINEFEIGAFSLGGKFALATFELFPELVKKMILVAPDGIKANFWYSVATYPIAIRFLFKRVVLKPGLFFSLVKILNSLRLVDKGLLRFAQSQMDTEEKRNRVYLSWVQFRHLKFEVNKIASMINTVRCELVIVVGKYDKIIPPKAIKPLTKYVEQKQVHVLEAGHNDLVSKAVYYLK